MKTELTADPHRYIDRLYIILYIIYILINIEIRRPKYSLPNLTINFRRSFLKILPLSRIEETRINNHNDHTIINNKKQVEATRQILRPLVYIFTSDYCFYLVNQLRFVKRKRLNIQQVLRLSIEYGG
jgi:hypothetical protein